MKNITRWQDHLLEQNSIEVEERDEKYNQRLKENRWFDNIKIQIERTGQVCLAY